VAETYAPLDLTPTEIPAIPEPKYDGSRYENERRRAEHRAEVARERVKRQAEARVNKGIDWSLCIVPGCGESLMWWGKLEHDRPNRRDSTMELPICDKHAAVVWNQLVTYHRKSRALGAAIADVNEMVAARRKREDEADKVTFMAREDGHIYFIRLGGMIKVGWTRDLWQRVKSYGASAELLASYPATRSDETNLHRQLRPALAKGREWYEDGPIVAAFVAEVLDKYGEPPAVDWLWTQPKRVVAGKRVGRR
jgi:hypothetical protein